MSRSRTLPPRPASSRRCRTAGRLVVGICVVASVTAVPAAARLSTTASVSQNVTTHAPSSVRVYWRGNGHGHGMSQYGALGAALKGLSTARILAFYYPGARLISASSRRIRVGLSAATSNTTVLVGTPGLRLSGYGTLPRTGYRRFRLVPSGGGLKLQGQRTTSWQTMKGGLAASADFSSRAGWVRLVLVGGSSTRYRGAVGAVRSGAGEITVNRLSLDSYTEGVVPREMPASWSGAALRAQAIAARSYARSSMDAAGNAPVDICDTTMCQVYGGMAHFDSRRRLLYTDDPAAISGNQNRILSYHGRAIFAQYSASNGGATVYGGLPYLVGRTDPYDTAASGDPYLSASTTVPFATVARAYGLRAVTSIRVTSRDGYGPWGGRVETAVVNGTAQSGHSARVTTTGFQLGAVLGVYTDYLRVAALPAA